MGVLRTWHCQSARCGREFTAWESNPECQHCGCARAAWVPAGGHIKGSSTKGADAELRALADVFRMGDMNSAQEGQAAKRVRLPDAPAANSGPVHTFAPGFSAPVNPNGGAACIPTSSQVDFKAKVGIGKTLTPSKVFPNVRNHTSVEAAHRS
jgi:hypothetical protein